MSKDPISDEKVFDLMFLYRRPRSAGRDDAKVAVLLDELLEWRHGSSAAEANLLRAENDKLKTDITNLVQKLLNVSGWNGSYCKCPFKPTNEYYCDYCTKWNVITGK